MNDLDLAADNSRTGGGTLPVVDMGDGVDASPRPFSMEGNSPEGSYAPTSTSHYSGNQLLAGGAGAAAANHYYNGNGNQQQMSQYHGGGTAPSVSSASVYPASTDPYANSVAGGGGMIGGGVGGGPASRLSKQQEAAREYAASHPHQYSGGSGEGIGMGGGPGINGGADGDTASMSAYSASGPLSATSGASAAPPRLSVMNPSVEDAAGEAGHDGAGPGNTAPPVPAVVQHRDGGRFRPSPENDVEIPPSYDSIPPEER